MDHPHVVQEEILEELRKQSFVLNKNRSEESFSSIKVTELETELRSLHEKFINMAELNAELSGIVANLTEMVNELDLVVSRFESSRKNRGKQSLDNHPTV